MAFLCLEDFFLRFIKAINLVGVKEDGEKEDQCYQRIENKRDDEISCYLARQVSGMEKACPVRFIH